MKRMIRITRNLLLAAVILLFAGLVAVRLEGPLEAVSGLPRVVDGDTLVMGGKRIRLAGIDAPELRQVCQRQNRDWPCGTEAKNYLSALIASGKAICDADGSDRYGRLLAICTVQNTDLNAAMVSAGYAVAFGHYEVEEGKAREGRLGLWAGTFDPPRTWRQTHGGMDEMPHIPKGWFTMTMSRIVGWAGDAVSRVWPE
jgi:endonuclease YncB( thermonuclease family)